MDAQIFDRMTRKLATGSSRRVLLRRFAAGFIGLAAVHATAGRTQAQTCAGIQESCAEIDCCYGYGCNENSICIAAAECSEFGEGCLVDEQCCQGYFCGEAGTCIAGAECSGFSTGCDIDDDCCSDLVCNQDGLCDAPGGNTDGGTDSGGNSDGGESTDVTELPGTGSGSGNSSTPWLAGAAAITAGAALIGGARLRTQPVPVDQKNAGTSSRCGE